MKGAGTTIGQFAAASLIWITQAAGIRSRAFCFGKIDRMGVDSGDFPDQREHRSIGCSALSPLDIHWSASCARSMQNKTGPIAAVDALVSAERSAMDAPDERVGEALVDAAVDVNADFLVVGHTVAPQSDDEARCRRSGDPHSADAARHDDGGNTVVLAARCH